MKAVIHPKYGPPNILQIKKVDRPIPQDKEILVQIYAATVNRTDCAMLRAKPFIMRFVTGFFKPKKASLGTDFAGKILAVGKDIRRFKVGDRIFGFNDMGLQSHAEYLTIAEDQAIATIPANITYEQAAASIEGAHYAYNFVNKVPLKAGETVLVNGATGAIGSAAVQILKHLGLTITAVCNTKNTGLIKSLGASKIIDYTTTDFTKDQQKYHYIFDAVGKSSFSKCKPLLYSGGVYISSELGWMAQNIFYSLTTPLFSKKKVKFPLPLDIKASVLLVKQWMEEGKFDPVIDRRYPLEQIVEAFNYVEKGEKTGNVILTLKEA